MIDRVFKLGVLIIGVLLLIIFYQLTQNDRYQMKDKIIIDTRTGIIYEANENDRQWVEADPKSGKTKIIPWNWTDNK